jgi:hypothetical protein
MGYRSPSLAERYYIHIPKKHVTAGHAKFLGYNAQQQVEVFPMQSQRQQ